MVMQVLSHEEGFRRTLAARICAIAWNEDRAAMFRRKAERHEANAARLKALAVNSPSTAVAEHGTHTGETDG